MAKLLPLLALGPLTFASGALAQIPPSCDSPPPPGAIIGEEGTVGERTVGAQPLMLIGRWSSDAYTRFHHVLVGRPGKLSVNLHACSSAAGGEPVAVYVTDSNGNRKLGWRLVVIATRNGNGRQQSISLPPPAKGKTLSRLPIVVVVENASRRPHTGEFRLTVSR